MASCQLVQVTCKVEVFKTKAYGKRQVGKGVHVLYIVAAAVVGGSFYVSIIYWLTVAVKYPFLSLQKALEFTWD